MGFRNTVEPQEADGPTTTRPRTWKRRAGVVALSAALLGGAVPAATAGAATAQPAQTASVAVAATNGPPGFVHYDSFFWGGDCVNRGNEGRDRGEWRDFRCLDGSAISYYHLWVLR
ncbi:MAG: hypothetical protein QOJ63_594 [Solirubrobacteraceae bacterium]|nr:hypothetical protein [Solirubrobacteraceae bacterium]